MRRLLACRGERLVIISLSIAAFCSMVVYFATSRLQASLGRSPFHPIWSLAQMIQSSTSCIPELVQVHYSQDGLLYLDDNNNKYPIPNCSAKSTIHPIITLVNNASRVWSLKLESQSRNFPAAVAEYRRRNNRNPPKGYDKWWDWAIKNNVKLLDEYDTLQRSIEPFFALPPRIFNQRVDALITKQTKWASGIFVVSIKNGKLSLSGEHNSFGPRAKQIINLLEDIAPFLPDLNLPIYREDLPAVSVSAENYEHHVQAARNKTFLSEWDLQDVKAEAGVFGWASTCPSQSHLRLRVDGLQNSYRNGFTQSFIHDPVGASRFCDHPNLLQLNGFLTSTRPKVHQFFPLGSFTKPHGFAELLLTPPDQFFRDLGEDPEWEEKQAKLFWRGSNTGTVFSAETNWRQSQRTRLVMLSNRSRGNISVRTTDSEENLAHFNADTKLLNQKYFDIAFSGSPIECDNADGTCEAVEKIYAFKPYADSSQNNRFKYILDVDGNGWSGRFHRLMSTKSAILKSTIFPEWYADRIQPWYHYIPVKVDYQDLYDIMAFLVGDCDGLNGHDEVGKRIGQAGQDWAKEFWRLTDMQAYMYLLLLEYSRLSNRDPNNLHSMDYL